MYKIIGLILATSSFNVFSFEHVSDVLPSGKIIICKNSDQERKGDIVENYRLKNFSSKTDETKIKVDEFKLPAIGDKIKIIRSTLVRKNKLESNFVNSEVGEAVVIEPNLTNELRTQITYQYRAIHQETQVAFTKEEMERVKNDCIVASPVGSSKFQNRDLVKF
jgi:hypothetical protein